nr:MAG TPA: hypothetical protein [Bacteriophage sp.]
MSERRGPNKNGSAEAQPKRTADPNHKGERGALPPPP